MRAGEDTALAEETTEVPAREQETLASGRREVAPRETEALIIARRNMAWSAAAGLLPLPGLDLAAILAVQLKMLTEIARLYEVPFRRDIAKELISTLLGSALTVTAAQASSSAVKGLPLIGQVAGMILQPAFAVAVTWAIAKVFIQHFESGGTFLDFHPETVKAYFREQFEAARRGVTGSTRV